MTESIPPRTDLTPGNDNARIGAVAIVLLAGTLLFGSLSPPGEAPYAYGILVLSLAAGQIWCIVTLMRNASAARRKLDETGHRLADERKVGECLQVRATGFDSASEGMIVTDRENRILAVNPALTARTGFTAEELIGKRPEVLRSGRHDSNYYRRMWSQLDNQNLWRGEIWNRRKNGQVLPEWLSIAVVRDAGGSPANYVAIFSDVSELKASEARAHHLAHHDALTDLPNRLLLQDRLDQAILQSKRANRRTAVLFLDLDGFKAINDSLGHELGDRLLIQVAERCASILRETDTISRQGGDEFVIVLPDLEQGQDAAQVARKLTRILDRPFLIGDHELVVTGSIGIALYPDDGQTASDLLRNADAAMYRTKADGRNGFQFFSSDMNVVSLGDLLLENQLRGAIGRNELFLHYQPKVSARDGVTLGLEALLRWQHPQQGILLPDRFIDAAEECGFGETIGSWVLNTVCRQLREWIDAGLRVLPVSINVSPQQFIQQNLADLAATALHNHRLPGSLLEFELTEPILMRDIARTIRVLDGLRQMGVRLAIDDFGTGYSSLSYVRQFPVQTLKLDQSFVKDVGTGGEAVRVAAAIIALAHGMSLQVVAEGVESETQCRHLLDHGCDQFQGFLFSRPMSSEQTRRWLAERSRRQ
jgi:diguanylate cyclase (GGDEF)-like protein/PAS domain S-box-containing protein